ncbi:MAG: hypothetical protein AAFW66_08150, partial [Pseudomonadota bacterium]
MNPKSILVIIAAGIATTLAFAAASRAGSGGILLLLVASFPIYVATLSWGTGVGIGSSILAIVATSTLVGPQAAVVMGLIVSIPASVIAHQANLAQENEDGTMDWYPLPLLFFNLTALLSVGIIAMGFIGGYQTDELLPQIEAAFREYARQTPDLAALDEDGLKEAAAAVLAVLPFMFAGMWLIVHVTNLHLASVVCRASKMMPRPKDDLPMTASLPKIAVGILLFSLLGTLVLSGALLQIATVIAGSFMMAFSLLGLAALHLKVRKTDIGFPLLVATYLIILLFYLPLFFFAIGGIMRALSNTPITPVDDGT